MMQVGAIWERWIEVLAGVLFAWREVWRARRVLIVQHANDRFVVRQAKPSGDRSILQAESEEISSIGFVSRNLVTPHDREPGEVISDTSLSIHPSDPDELRISASLPGEAIRIDDPESSPTESAVLAAGSRAPDDVVRAAQNDFVVLELPTDKIVVRRISVPAQAREFLPGIVRNQVERLSPWPADQTVYGFDAAVSQEDSVALDVRVFMSSRAAVNSVRDELDAIGLPPDRIVARQDGTPVRAPVALWSRLADVPRETVERTRRQIGVSIAAFALLSVALSLWGFFSAASIRSESDDLAAPRQDIAAPGSGIADAAGHRIATIRGTRLGLERDFPVRCNRARSPFAGAARRRLPDGAASGQFDLTHDRLDERRPVVDWAARALRSLDCRALLRTDTAGSGRLAVQVSY